MADHTKATVQDHSVSNFIIASFFVLFGMSLIVLLGIF